LCERKNAAIFDRGIFFGGGDGFRAMGFRAMGEARYGDHKHTADDRA
jgi:hypothetical protein